MDSFSENDSARAQADAQAGLPPVLPPSGRFIAQLFVVPGLIILAVVLLMIGVS